MWKKADRLACPLLVFGSLFEEGERGQVRGRVQEPALEFGLFLELCGPFENRFPMGVGIGQGGTADDVCGPAHEAGGGLEIS